MKMRMTSKTKRKPLRLDVICREHIDKMIGEREWWAAQEESCAKVRNYTGAQEAKSIVDAISKTIEILKEN